MPLCPKHSTPLEAPWSSLVPLKTCNPFSLVPPLPTSPLLPPSSPLRVAALEARIRLAAGRGAQGTSLIPSIPPTRASATQLDVAVELKSSSGASNGWFALGWASGGGMAPADAIIGNKDGGLVSSYYIDGYTMSSLKGGSFDIGGSAGTVTSASGSTVIQFSRTANTGSIPVKMSGVHRIIWAHSPANSKTLAFHFTAA
ncbi:unnamed protein product [Closterium sp. NIES-65]|nr:unnamed protein product [Closterium sp. NIES-65]